MADFQQRIGIISQCPVKSFRRLVSRFQDCDWIQMRKIGEGKQGKVYQVCCEGNCKFAVKVRKNERESSSFEKRVLEEIAFQEMFSQMGLAPTIQDAWVCDKDYYVVMDKVDTTIEDYILKQLCGHMKLQDIDKIINQLENEVIHKLLPAIHGHHTGLGIGYIHGDLKMDNIAINFQPNGSHKLLVIDCGMSKEVESPQIADIKETPNELRLSFNLLRATARERCQDIGFQTSKKAIPPTPMKRFAPPPAPHKKSVFASASKPAVKMRSFEEEDDSSEFSTPTKKEITPKKMKLFDDEEEEEDDKPIVSKRLFF